MKKVCIIGAIAEKQNLLDGQTVKTRILIKELKHEYGNENVYCIDTYGKINQILMFLRIIFGFFLCRNVIMLPAENGLKIITPFLVVTNKMFKRRLHYDVIGGWLPAFLVDKNSLVDKLKTFHSIYVETQTMKSSLERKGFANVMVVPNCKEISIVKDASKDTHADNTIRLVTFSRVMKAKGIEDAAVAVREANQVDKEHRYHLDVYGRVAVSETEWFAQLQENYKDELTYGGLISFNKSSEVLKDYYALLFPTYYEGEGFAGTLIDAFAAGLPVIASDWKYNSEIVTNEVEGLIVPTHNTEKLTKAIIRLGTDPELRSQYSKKCTDRARSYLPSVALRVVKERLA